MVGGRNHCFVLGCTTGYYSDRRQRKLAGQKSLSIFSTPNDPEVFEKWKRQLSKSNRELTKESRICELHFAEDDIKRYYITKLPDGSVSKLERGKFALKPGAVPYKFLNLSSVSKKTTKRKISTIKNPDDVIMKLEDEIDRYCSTKLSDESVSKLKHSRVALKLGPVSNNFLNLNSSVFKKAIKREKPDNVVIKTKEDSARYDEHNEMTYILGLQNESVTGKYKLLVESIKTPSQWWGICSTPKFIICSKWDVTYFPELRVIIKCDLTVQVYIRNHEVRRDEMLKISSVEDITNLLLEVDRYQICAGIDDECMTRCMGYLSQKKLQGRLTVRCNNCRIDRKKIYNRQRQRKISIVNKFKKMQQLVSCDVKENCHLKQKVTKLEENINSLMNKCATDEAEINENMIQICAIKIEKS